MKSAKNPKQLERYFKGAANHSRISIILLLDAHKQLTLGQISGIIKGNNKTVSEHTHRLVKAGLANKKRAGKNVMHVLSPYGHRFVKFIRSF